MVRLTEETRIYVADEDGYPWISVFRAVLGLHAPSAYALFTRWADLEHLGIRSDVEELSKAGLTKGHLKANQALGLLRLGWDGRSTASTFPSILDVSLAQSGVQSDTFRNHVRIIVNWVLRDISRDERANCARRILDWLNANNCSHLLECRPLQKYLAFVATHPQQEASSSHPQESNWSERTPTEKIDWDLFFGQASIPARLPELLTGLRELPGYQGRSTFLSLIHISEPTRPY